MPNASIDKKRFVPMAEVRRRFGFSCELIRRWVESDQVVTLKMPMSRPLVDIEDVERLIRESVVEADRPCRPELAQA